MGFAGSRIDLTGLNVETSEAPKPKAERPKRARSFAPYPENVGPTVAAKDSRGKLLREACRPEPRPSTKRTKLRWEVEPWFTRNPTGQALSFPTEGKFAASGRGGDASLREEAMGVSAPKEGGVSKESSEAVSAAMAAYFGE